MKASMTMTMASTMATMTTLAIMFSSTTATINLEDIDLAAIQDRLISPVGMVNQFALQTEITGIGALGWVTLGLLWRLAISSFSTGPIGSFLAGFEFLFSTQSLALTIIRSLFDMARDLASRLAITFLFYGAEQTIAGLTDVSLQSVKDFLFDEELLVLVTGRSFAQFFIFIVAIVPIYLFAIFLYPTVREVLPSSRSRADEKELLADLPNALTEGIDRVVSRITL